MELSNTFTVGEPIDVTWPVLCDIERIAPCMPGAQLTEVDGEVFSGQVKLKVGPINARFKGTAEMVERDDDAHRAVLKAKGKDTGGKGNADATITATAEPDGDGTRVTIATDLSITGKVAQFGRGALDDISTKLLGQFVDCLETNVLAGEAGAGSTDSTEVASSAGGAASAAEGAADGEADGEAARSDGSTPAPATAGAGSPVATAPVPPPGGMPAGSAATGGEAAAGTPGASTATPAASASSSASASGTGPRRIDGPEAEPIDLLDATGGAAAARKAAGPVAAVMAVLFVIWWWRRRK